MTTPLPFDKFNLLIIDPQRDFIDESTEEGIKNFLGNDHGRLAVGGAAGDMNRIAKMIETNKDKIIKIFVSMDTHTKYHIGHRFWRKLNTDGTLGGYADIFTVFGPNAENTDDYVINKYGVGPDPNNPIIAAGAQKYVANVEDENERKVMTKYGKIYAEKVLKETKMAPIVWPIHCIQGSKGWEISPTLQTALDTVSEKVEYHVKGKNQLAEMYSIMKAEVPYEDILYSRESLFSDEEKKIIEDYQYNPIDDTSADNGSEPSFMKRYDESLQTYEKSIGKIPEMTKGQVAGVNLSTKFNNDLYTDLIQFPIVVCGEALSHCVNYSTRDIKEKLKKDNNNTQVYLIKNGSSAVYGYDKDANEFVAYMGNNVLTSDETTGALSLIVPTVETNAQLSTELKPMRPPTAANYITPNYAKPTASSRAKQTQKFQQPNQQKPAWRGGGKKTRKNKKHNKTRRINNKNKKNRSYKK